MSHACFRRRSQAKLASIVSIVFTLAGCAADDDPTGTHDAGPLAIDKDGAAPNAPAPSSTQEPDPTDAPESDRTDAGPEPTPDTSPDASETEAPSTDPSVDAASPRQRDPRDAGSSAGGQTGDESPDASSPDGTDAGATSGARSRSDAGVQTEAGSPAPIDAGTTNFTEIVVEADDGSATLTIPIGALPRGVPADAISITRDDSLVTEFDGTALVWVLEPDGLELAVPAHMDLRVNVPPGAVFFIRHLSALGLEALDFDLEDTVINEEQGGLEQVSVDVAHFSAVGFFNHEILPVDGIQFEIDWADPAHDTVVGGTTTPSIRVTPPAQYSAQLVLGNDTYRSEAVQTYDNVNWSATALWEATSNLTPRTHNSGKIQSSASWLDIPQPFNCGAAGDFAIGVTVFVDVVGNERYTYQRLPTDFDPFGDPESVTNEPYKIYGHAWLPTSGVCSEPDPHDCSDPDSGCTDESGDCGLPTTTSGVLELATPETTPASTCVGHEFADIEQYSSQCADGLTITTQMAAPIPTTPGAFLGRYQTTLFLRGPDPGTSFQLVGISDDAGAFEVFISGSSVDVGNTVSVDQDGNLVQHVSQATIDGIGAPVDRVMVDTFLSLDSEANYRFDETREFPYPCP